MRTALPSLDTGDAPRAVPLPTFSAAVAAHGLTAAAVDALVEQLPTGVLVAAGDGHVVYANAAARRLEAERIEPLRWAVTRALLTEEAPEPTSITLHAGRPERRTLRYEIALARDAGGRVAGAVVALADVTAQVRVAEWQPLVDSLMSL